MTIILFLARASGRGAERWRSGEGLRSARNAPLRLARCRAQSTSPAGAGEDCNKDNQ